MVRWRKRGAFALGGTTILAVVLIAFAPFDWRSEADESPGPDTLPSSITNAEFWRMIEEFSEPAGYFRSDNFLSNESKLQDVIPRLKQRIKPGGVYIGVGPEQNFTYILAFEPKLSFIVDIRRLNMLEHLLYKALFELSSDRADFVSRLFSRKRPAAIDLNASVETIFNAYESVPGDRMLFERNMRAVLDQLTLVEEHGFPLSEDDEVQIRYAYSAFLRAGPGMSYTFLGSYYQGTLGMPTYKELMKNADAGGNNWSFLANEDRFRRMKELEKRNLIVPLVGDFAGRKTLRAVGDFLKKRDAVLNVFYVSNVEMYLFQQGDDWKLFYKNVESIPRNPASAFVRFTAGRGGSMKSQVWSPINDVLASYRNRKIDDYASLIEMSR